MESCQRDVPWSRDCKGSVGAVGGQTNPRIAASRLRGPIRTLAVQLWRIKVMKTHYIVAMAMLAGFGLGAVAVQSLHAQAKPPVYYISEIDVSNPDAYGKEYAPQAQAMIKAAGGRFVAIGGTAGVGAGKVTAFDGELPKRVTVQVWDSMEKIQAWRADPAYIALRKIGDTYAKYHSYAVDGVLQ
jgi:uncharacterized protein (DUF1330 family)